MADPTILDIFTFQFIRGNPQTAFKEPYSLVITEKIADKYFGDEDPIGKIITYENMIDFRVTGVLQNIPKNSHFKFDLLSTFAGCPDLHLHADSYESQWIDINYWVYILLTDNYPIQELEEKSNNLLTQQRSESSQNFQDSVMPRFQIYLQPILDIHLHSHLSNEFETNGNINNLYYSIRAIK